MAGKERLHGGHFPKCIVLQAVFWYLRYSLSYRDIEELMKERGVELDHATVPLWVVKYTHDMHTRIVGHEVTGIPAYR
jgi:putative transposase